MRIRLLRRWSDYTPGVVVDLHPRLAQALIDDGIARTQLEPTAEEVEVAAALAEALNEPEAAVEPQPDEVAVAPRPKRRRRGPQ